MSRFSMNDRVVQAIRDGVAELRQLHAARGWYDGHDLITWLSDHRNPELNSVIDYYTRGDPVHTATVQIGNFLKNRMGQEKIGERVSTRRIRLRGGANRDGECNVSVWRT